MPGLYLLVITITAFCIFPQSLAITKVTVIDPAGRQTLPGQTVLITGNRITSVGPATRVEIPKGSITIDAAGKFLIPGLWDMHVHTTNQNDFLRLYLANGVTGVRDMTSPMPGINAWRKALAEGKVLPRVYAAGPIIDGKEPVWGGHSIGVTTEAEAREAVRTVKKLGADFVKVYSLLNRESYFAIADEAKKIGIPFAGHAPESITAAEASDAGQRSFEHQMGLFRASSTLEPELRNESAKRLANPNAAALVSLITAQYKPRTMIETFSEAKATALFERLAKNGTWQTPTLINIQASGSVFAPEYRKDPRLKYIRPGLRNAWDPRSDFRYKNMKPTDVGFDPRLFRKELELVGRLHRAGVGILAGTDAPNAYCYPGFALHDELALLVEAGLSPMDALRTATYNPAKYFEKTDSFGTIEPGKIADLVLLDANPLDDIRNTRKIAAVVANGNLLDRKRLDALLAEVENAVARQPL